MSPDTQFEEKRVQQEEEKLQSIVSKLTDTDKQRVFKLGISLDLV